MLPKIIMQQSTNLHAYLFSHLWQTAPHLCRRLGFYADLRRCVATCLMKKDVSIRDFFAATRHKAVTTGCNNADKQKI